MKTTILHQKITDFKGDTIIVNLFEGIKVPGGATGAVDKTLNRTISKLIAAHEISGKLGECTVLHTFNRLAAKRVIIVGLGKAADFNLEQIRKAAAAAIKKARAINAKKIGTIVHGAGIGGLDPKKAVQALVEGSLLALYEFNEYKKPVANKIKTLTLVENDKKKIAHLRSGLFRGLVMANSQNIARDFINAPANNLTPGKLVIRLKKTISTLKLGRRLQYRLLKKNDLQRLAMGALLSVAQGSANQPRFVVLRYRGAKKPLVGLIGKTVTFDSGGISLKTPVGMEKMKGDMAGGAAAIGATLALATLRAKVNLMTIIPAVENMPSGSASRPGDVVWAMNNKSIEIISTDAEGRMTLADALCYAEKQKAKIIIDIATLTGGCVVALGDITAAVMGNNQTLIDKLLTITRQTGEKMWQLPLSTEYEEQIKSTIADMKNSGGRKASSITAGLFLKNFVDKANWLHIDMAGKEISEREKFYTQKGGTGYGVRTIVDFIEEVS